MTLVIAQIQTVTKIVTNVRNVKVVRIVTNVLIAGNVTTVLTHKYVGYLWKYVTNVIIVHNVNQLPMTVKNVNQVIANHAVNVRTVQAHHANRNAKKKNQKINVINVKQIVVIHVVIVKIAKTVKRNAKKNLNLNLNLIL